MNANRRMLRNDKAEVGIGTLIVFIAMVLVASVAAAVLVNTSGVLQSRALATGKASSDEIASNLKLVEVYGNRTGGAGNIRGITVYISLSAGGLPVNLDNIWIHFTDAAGGKEVKKGASATDSAFTHSFVRENGASNSILEQGEVAKLKWIVDLTEREQVRMTINPEMGQQSFLEFYTPTGFGTLTDVQLL